MCIMQRWGGKREVMYTAFKALGDSVDYIQVSCNNAVNDEKNRVRCYIFRYIQDRCVILVLMI